jgi:tRNA pseudouridine55 synthase
MELLKPIKQPLSKLSDFQEGQVVLVDKPLEWTSFDVVNKIRIHLKRSLGINKIKVGHAGTLDPLATGLLVICTGKYTKRIQEIQHTEKEYTGTLILGATTPSFDRETEVDQTYPLQGLDECAVKKAFEKQTGHIEQVPPIFSAIKVDGVRAYKKARRKENVKLKAKNIVVSRFEITAMDLPKVAFRVVCSKGTYIRSLVNEVGKSLDNGAFLNSLHRTRIGDYSITEALSMDELLK